MSLGAAGGSITLRSLDEDRSLEEDQSRDLAEPRSFKEGRSRGLVALALGGCWIAPA